MIHAIVLINFIKRHTHLHIGFNNLQITFRR